MQEIRSSNPSIKKDFFNCIICLATEYNFQKKTNLNSKDENRQKRWWEWSVFKKVLIKVDKFISNKKLPKKVDQKNCLWPVKETTRIKIRKGSFVASDELRR